MVDSISTSKSLSAVRRRHGVGDIVRARDLRVGDIVSIIDTDTSYKIVTKTFFEIIAIPILKDGKKADHRHRIQLLTFTRVVLLERA